MTRQKFIENAKALVVRIDETVDHAVLKQFSTGSVGWTLIRKIDVTLPDGSVVRCQVGLNITAIGSKSW